MKEGDCIIDLSKSEYEVLTLLWSEDRGLTASEINKLKKNKSWKNSSIHLILTSMLEKGAVVVDGMAKSGRTYSRVFYSAITLEEYSLMQMQENVSFAKDKNSVITGLFASLINSDEISPATIASIEELIKKKKDEQ